MTERRGRELPAHQQHQIRRLRREGKSIREIAEISGVAKRTVEKYVADLPNPRKDPPPGVTGEGSVLDLDQEIDPIPIEDLDPTDDDLASYSPDDVADSDPLGDQYDADGMP